MMKRPFLTTLSAMTLTTVAIAPASAIDEYLNNSMRRPNSTTTVIPLVETIRVRGRISQINGDRVRLTLPEGGTRTYRISTAQQQQYGLSIGKDVIVNVRRLYNNAIAVDDITLIEQ